MQHAFLTNRNGHDRSRKTRSELRNNRIEYVYLSRKVVTAEKIVTSQ